MSRQSPRRRRDETPAIARHIPYDVLVAPQILRLSAGGYLAAWRIGGQAFECREADDLNAAHERLNVLMRNLAAPDVAIWSHVVRDVERDRPVRAPADGFAGRLAARYQARLEGEQLRRNELYLSLIYKPTRLGGGRAAFARRPSEERREELARDLTTLANLSRQIEAALGAYDPLPLGNYETDGRAGSALLEFLARLVNGEWQRMPLVAGSVAPVLGTSRLLFGWETIEYRSATATRLGAVLGIKEYPSPTWPGMLDGLLAAPFSFVLTQSFSCLSRQASLGLLDRQAHRLENAGDAAISQALALRQAIDRVASGEFVLGDHHFSLQVLGEPYAAGTGSAAAARRLGEHLATARALLADAGCVTAREDLALEAAHFAQLPGHFAARPRIAPITSRNHAALVPLHDYPSGRAHGNHWGEALADLKTDAGTVYHFSLHASDPNDPDGGSRKDTGHTFVCGPTGSGKTVFIGFCIAMLCRFGATQVIFDKDCGLEILVRALDGQYLPLRRGEPTGCNPLQLSDEPHHRAFLRRWLLLLLARPGRALTVREEAEVDEALAGVRALAPATRRLSRLLEFLDSTNLDGPYARLAPWCRATEGPYAWVFDGETDRIADTLGGNALVGFDMTELLGEPAVCAPVTAYLFHLVERLLDGRRLVAWIDEFSRLIGSAAFADLASDGTKTWRKRNAVMAFATQSPNDIAGSPIARSLVEQTPTKILFPNPDAARADYLDAMGLSAREYELLRSGIAPGSRRFLIRQGRDSVVAELDLKGLEAELDVISGRTATVECVRALIERLGPHASDWLPEFLSTRTHIQESLP